VRFDGIGFALWTERARLLEIVTREQRVSADGGGWFGPDSGFEPYAELRTGAHVRVLGHKETRAQIRYLGALEIDGWVPDTALTERTRDEHRNAGRFPSGMQSLMVLPGTELPAPDVAKAGCQPPLFCFHTSLMVPALPMLNTSR